MKFQFHIGAIRSAHGEEDSARRKWFQFHIGAIRSIDESRTFIAFLCFNSILVQLEGLLMQDIARFETCFNSILVQLEVEVNQGL